MAERAAQRTVARTRLIHEQPAEEERLDGLRRELLVLRIPLLVAVRHLAGDPAVRRRARLAIGCGAQAGPQSSVFRALLAPGRATLRAGRRSAGSASSAECCRGAARAGPSPAAPWPATAPWPAAARQGSQGCVIIWSSWSESSIRSKDPCQLVCCPWKSGSTVTGGIRRFWTR